MGPSPLPWAIPHPQELLRLALSIKPPPFLRLRSLQLVFRASSVLHSLTRPTGSLAAPQTLHQSLGIGPLIRHMNKSQRLLKRRAVLSAIIKWCVSAEEGAIKTVWEKEGKVREGTSEALTLQLGLKGRQTIARRAVSWRAGCPGRQSRLCSGGPGLTEGWCGGAQGRRSLE